MRFQQTVFFEYFEGVVCELAVGHAQMGQLAGRKVVVELKNAWPALGFAALNNNAHNWASWEFQLPDCEKFVMDEELPSLIYDTSLNLL